MSGGLSSGAPTTPAPRYLSSSAFTSLGSGTMLRGSAAPACRGDHANISPPSMTTVMNSRRSVDIHNLPEQTDMCRHRIWRHAPEGAAETRMGLQYRIQGVPD